MPGKHLTWPPHFSAFPPSPQARASASAPFFSLPGSCFSPFPPSCLPLSRSRLWAAVGPPPLSYPGHFAVRLLLMGLPPPEVPGSTWGSGRLSETKAPALRRSGAQCPPARASGTPSRLRFSSPREPARGHSPGGVGGVRAGEGERCRGRGPAAAAGQEEKESGLAQPLPSDALSAHRRPPSPGLSEGEGEIRAGQSHRRPLPVTPTSRSTELGVFIPKLLL